MHQPGPDAERDHVRKNVFDVDPEQCKKRKKKVPENDDHADTKPTPFFAEDIPKCFLGNIGIPNDEILPERHVSVEDRESEEYRPEKIVLMLMKHVRENALAI